MKLVLLFLFSGLILLANAQKITKELVEEQENLCPAKYLIERINEDIRNNDTLSVEEIKKFVEKNYNYMKKEKKAIIRKCDEHIEYEDKYFLLRKSSLPDEDKTNKYKDTYSELVNNNHLMYRDNMQKGLFFDMEFKNNTSVLKFIGRNDGATVHKFSTGETIHPFFYANSQTENKINVTNVYYKDGKEPNVPFPIKYSFPLNPVPIPQMKHVDSIDMNFKLKYLTKVDTIRFDRNDIGVEKSGILLLKMEDNYFEYLSPCDYHRYYPGKIIETEYYNSKGEILQLEYCSSNLFFGSSEEKYKNSFARISELYKLIQKTKTREEAYNVIKYVELKHTNKYLHSKRKTRTLVRGNISSIKMYLENSRDTISFDARFRNKFCSKELHIHKVNDTTEFIDRNGNVLIQIPNNINFLYEPVTNKYSENYFYIVKNDVFETYYFLDKKNRKYVKLPYERLKFICPSLIVATTPENKHLLLNPLEYKIFTDKKFINYRQFGFGERALSVSTKDKTYNLYDQNNKQITNRTVTPITKIKLVEESY